MYDDDKHEKELARNQLIFFLLMGVLLVIWFQYFVPKRPPQQPQQPTESVNVALESPSSKAVALAPAVAPESGTAAPAWPNLPPVADSVDPVESEITLKKGDMELVFTRVGARLKRASLLSAEYGEFRIQLVPESNLPDAETVYPFGVRFTNEALQDELDRRLFEVESMSDSEVVFSLTLPDVAVVRKRYAFSDKPHVVTATVEYQNIEKTTRVLGRDQEPAFIFTWGPNVNSQDLQKGVQQALVWRSEGQNSLLGTASMEPDDENPVFVKRIIDPDWLAIRSAYFIVAMRPGFEPNLGIALGNPKEFRFGVAVPRVELAPGETLTRSFDVYIGPSHLEQLQEAWPTLATALQFFEWPQFMDWFAKLLLQMLNWFYTVIPNYGIAIILLTVCVRLLMFPLTLKQMRTMKRMQLLAPEMEKIKQQYGEDAQEMQRRTMELYKEYGLNPVAGCLPMFLQLPIFIALYRMLWSAYELRGAPFFLWIRDLSEPDKLLHIPALAQLPFFLHHLQYINVLPVLSALAMVASVKLTPMSTPVQNPQQKMLMTVMPVVFSVFCYPLASGLNLYILTSTLLGIVQSYVLHFQDVEKPEKVKPKKKQHFYTAAVQKKKQIERERREQKKRGKDNREKDTRKTADDTTPQR